MKAGGVKEWTRAKEGIRNGHKGRMGEGVDIEAGGVKEWT